MNWDVIKTVRKNVPLIHHLTNQVVANFTANGLLSFGGAPVMAKAIEEVEEMASHADGVLINVGTLTSIELQSMIAAGKAANQKGIPVVLDPVGISATHYRFQAAKEIIQQVHVTAIKGNAGEMACLVNIPWETKGVDSIGDGNIEEVAQKVAKVYGTNAIVTGATDIICTGEQIIHNETGHPILEKVTGAGCLLGSIITACLTTNHSTAEKLTAAVAFYGLVAEYAASDPSVSGSGTFLPKFIDALSFDVERLLKG